MFYQRTRFKGAYQIKDKDGNVLTEVEMSIFADDIREANSVAERRMHIDEPPEGWEALFIVDSITDEAYTG